MCSIMETLLQKKIKLKTRGLKSLQSVYIYTFEVWVFHRDWSLENNCLIVDFSVWVLSVRSSDSFENYPGIIVKGLAHGHMDSWLWLKFSVHSTSWLFSLWEHWPCGVWQTELSTFLFFAIHHWQLHVYDNGGLV